MPDDRGRLLLEWPDFTGRLYDLLQRIGSDAALREAFLRDPAPLMASAVGLTTQPGMAGAPEVSRPNRLVFALLSNPDFRGWANNYQREFEQRAVAEFPDLEPGDAALALSARVSREDIYRDLVQAITTFGDRETFFELGVLHGAQPTPQLELILVLLLIAIIYVIIPVSGLEHDTVPAAALESFTREDLRRAADIVLSALTTRAQEVRSEGKLGPPEAGP